MCCLGLKMCLQIFGLLLLHSRPSGLFLVIMVEPPIGNVGCHVTFMGAISSGNHLAVIDWLSSEISLPQNLAKYFEGTDRQH